MSRRVLAAFGLLSLLPLLLVGYLAFKSDASPGADQAAYRGSVPPARFALPSFALRDQAGVLVRSEGLRGQVVVLTFLDSQCKETCPILASVIARTIDRLRPEERGQVSAIAISTDPKEDTLASVRRFLQRNRASTQIRYLVGAEPEMRALWHKFLILSSLESGRDSLHSAPVRLYSGDGVWLATQHAGVDLTLENLLYDIRLALAAGKKATG